MPDEITHIDISESDTQEMDIISLCKWCQGVGSIAQDGSDTASICSKCAGTGLHDSKHVDYEQRYNALKNAIQPVLDHIEVFGDNAQEVLLLRLNGTPHYYKTGDQYGLDFLRDLDAVRKELGHGA